MKNLFVSVGCFLATLCVASAQSPTTLQFTNEVLNRKIVLYDWTGQEHQYAGFGINPGVLRYQVPDVSNSHVFYAAIDGNSSRELLRITGQGKVGIGTQNPGNYTLAVAGKIGSWEEVRVLKLNAPFPDYVFATDYKLRPLTDVAAYIAQHRHLPEVPSAAEVEEKGLGLSEMQLIAMKKIEELTLYLIALQEKVERLEAQNQALAEKLSQQEDK